MADTSKDIISSVTDAIDSGAETAREAASATRDRFQRLSSDVQERYEKASKDVRRGAERASSELRRGVTAARERYDDATEAVKQGYDKARTQASDLSKDVSVYVRQNPGKSVLMAAGVGFLIGLLFRGRRDSEE